MIDAKHVHKLLECKYDFKHWIKDVISSFNFKDGIDYISYRYDNNREQIIDNNSHVFRHDYYLFPKSILCIIYMKCDRFLFKDFIYDIFDCCNIKNDDRVEYEFDNKNLDHITFKGDGKESFSFNRVLVENLIETFETMQDIYSDNYRLKVYTGNCIIQLNANPKDPSESFFDVYDRDETKLIYGIEIGILKEMFGI